MQLRFLKTTALCLSLLLEASAHAQLLKSYRVAVVSDMNESYGSTSYQPALDVAIAHIRESGADLVLSTGDMVAGQKSGLNYARMWSAFHNHVTLPLNDSGVPFLPSPGNHDAATGFQVERAEYERTWKRFPLERFNVMRPADEQVHFLPGVAQSYPFFYAVTMGPALFIALDSTVPARLINNQFAWLKEVLAQGQGYPVKIIFGHFPLYPFAFQRAHEALAQGSLSSGLYKQMEDLLAQYDVDIYLSGHHHVYYPARRNGRTQFVSVPLLGTGARYLLNSQGVKAQRSPQGFLWIDFDTQGSAQVQAVASPSLKLIGNSTLPAAISLPAKESDDCKGCKAYPSAFFLNSVQRILYWRW